MAPRAPFIAPPQYNTPLSTLQEMAFRGWLVRNNVPFNPDAAQTDYDMRGYWQGLQQGNPQASPSSMNANDGQLHYPDYYKTPLHKSFSNESQWAGPDAPSWVNDSQLAAQDGRVVYDEKSKGLFDLLLRGR